MVKKKLGQLALSHRFWDTATYWLKVANFSYPPLFYPDFEGVPLALDRWSYACEMLEIPG